MYRACIVDCCCCLVYGEDLYRLLPAIQSISFIYESNMFKMKYHTQGNNNNQQCMQLIFTIHNIEFHTQREITRVYNIAYAPLMIYYTGKVTRINK
jgi:hypothetical protein